MELTALEARLDNGDTAGALAEAEARLPESVAGDRLKLLLFVARGYGITGAPVDALRAALQARALAVEHADKKAEAEALLMAGATHQRVDEHAASLGYFDQAETLLEKLDEPHLLNGLFRRMGVSCSMLGRHDQALKYIDRSINIIPADASAQDRMSSRNSMINARSRRIDAIAKADPDQSAAYLALVPLAAALAADAEASGCHRIAVLAEANHGTLLVKAGRYQEGIDALRVAFEKIAVIGLRSDKGAAMGSIGTAYLKLGRFSEAIDAFRLARDFLDGGSIAFLRDTWDGIAAAHEGLGQLQEALAAYKSARALEQRLVDNAAVANLEKHELRSDMARVTAEMARLADEDALTGLQNRRATERMLEAAYRSARPQLLSLLFIDLDHFKQINDRYGHATGDAVLRECAQLMKQSSRGGDVAARWGGEEFLLLLINADLQHGTDVAERLRDAIAQHDWPRIHPELAVTTSIGLATSHEQPEKGVAALLALADERLYAAKKSGRNRVVAAGGC